MLFRSVRPVRRKDSRNLQFARRIPADVKAQAVGLTLTFQLGDETLAFTITPRTQIIRFSLRTNDPAEVKARNVAADSHLDHVWAALRNDAPVSLAHEQAVALSQELYLAWANAQRERTTAMEYNSAAGKWERVREPRLEAVEWEAVIAHWGMTGARDLEKPLGAILDRLLLARGIRRVTPETRSMILAECWRALQDAFEKRKRNAESDYAPDPKSERFPAWTTPARNGVTVSLTGLVNGWWSESERAGLKPSTHESYRNTMAGFVALLGHDDASRVTLDDVQRFKAHRLAAINPRTKMPISAKTVKDSDLSALKTVFGWAVANRRMTTNPAAGVSLKLGRKRRLRPTKGFTNAEAVALLTAAANLKQAGERPQTFAAKRWVPWLLAYTGARVGEMAQLRKEDVRREDKHWVVRITPDAGPVKTDEARDVVLHPHLVEIGFVSFVEAAPEGHLFLKPSLKRGIGDQLGVRGPLRGVKNRIAEFARSVVADKNVAPNHGWRHRFKTVGLEVSIEHRVLDAIQGQRPRNVAEGYGDVTIRTQAAAIARIPRYQVT